CLVVFSSLPLLGRSSSVERDDGSSTREAPEVTIRSPRIRVVPIQVYVKMELLDVTVTDASGRVVTGFDRNNFRVFDDKVEQQIVSFSYEDTPISVGMVFDASRSMEDKLQQSRQAAVQFFKTANPEDEFNLIS